MKSVLTILVLAALLACQKEPGEDLAGTVTSNGTLLWLGSPAVDGCGLVLEVNPTWYFIGSEKNAAITFTEDDGDSIDVTATYRITGEERTIWWCTTTPIEIVKIKRR